MQGRWNGIRGRGTVGSERGMLTDPDPSREPGAPPRVAIEESTRPAAVHGGQTLSWTPCHGRRVRIAGDVTGSNVVVRCPYCSQLWEVRFPPAATKPLFALWVA